MANFYGLPKKNQNRKRKNHARPVKECTINACCLLDVRLKKIYWAVKSCGGEVLRLSGGDMHDGVAAEFFKD